MMKLAILLVGLFSGVLSVPDFSTLKSLSQADTQIWAVLVAGSDTWGNYRHQADICHSYQILHSHGIPDERIIVMMTDDLANNQENPTPGIVINHLNGHDVYKGVPHDYTHDDVTPENFMAVLRGDKKALKGKGSGKVLNRTANFNPRNSFHPNGTFACKKMDQQTFNSPRSTLANKTIYVYICSGPNDHVFVYFADHGAPGIIAFPESELSATDLNKTIDYMHTHKKYKKLVLYIEACESGSMFENILPNNINVFATTAANAEESSYACYFDEKRETYLGDVYSVNWMEDSDKEDLSKETLTKQFQIVKKETNTSHVQEYGDVTIGTMHVSEFQGKKKTVPIVYPEVPYDAVRSRDVPIEILKRKIERTNNAEEMQNLLKTYRKMIRNRKFMSDRMEAVIDVLSLRDANIRTLAEKHLKLKNYKCYDEVRKYFQEECFEISKNEYALDFMYLLVNLCEYGVDAQTQKLAMEQVCTHPSVYGIN